MNLSRNRSIISRHRPGEAVVNEIPSTLADIRFAGLLFAGRRSIGSNLENLRLDCGLNFGHQRRDFFRRPLHSHGSVTPGVAVDKDPVSLPLERALCDFLPIEPEDGLSGLLADRGPGSYGA